MNPYPTVNPNSDTAGLSVEGTQLLGAGVGVTAGYVVGKGKLVPMLLGAGLGYLVSHLDAFKKLTGS